MYDLSTLALIASDPALAASHRAQYPDAGRLLLKIFNEPKAIKLGACPPLAEIVCVQNTMFDNGEGKRRAVSRYTMSVKVWTREPGNFKAPDWEANIALRACVAPLKARDQRPDAEIEVQRLLAKGDKLNSSIRPDDVNEIAGLCATYTHAYLAHQTGAGMHYLTGHYGAAQIADGHVNEMTLITPEFFLVMPTGSKLDAKRSPLTGKRMTQSRWAPAARTKLAAHWASADDGKLEVF